MGELPAEAQHEGQEGTPGRGRQKEAGLREESPRLPCSRRGPGRPRGAQSRDRFQDGGLGRPRHALCSDRGLGGRWELGREGRLRGALSARPSPGHQHPARSLRPVAPGSCVLSLLSVSRPFLLQLHSVFQGLLLIPPNFTCFQRRPANEQCYRLHPGSAGKGAARSFCFFPERRD